MKGLRFDGKNPPVGRAEKLRRGAVAAYDVDAFEGRELVRAANGRGAERVGRSAERDDERDCELAARGEIGVIYFVLFIVLLCQPDRVVKNTIY